MLTPLRSTAFSYSILAGALCVCAAGCGPTRLLPPPPELPKEVEGRSLWNTPVSAIYARDKAVAAEAETMLNALDSELRKCCDRPLGRGILIVVDTVDEKGVVTSLAEAERLGKDEAGKPRRQRAKTRFAATAKKRADKRNEPATKRADDGKENSGDDHAHAPTTTSAPTDEPASQPTSRPAEKSAEDARKELEEMGITEDVVCRMVVAPLDALIRERLALQKERCPGYAWVVCYPSKRQSTDSLGKITDAAIAKEGGFAAKLMIAPWLPLIHNEVAKKIAAGTKLLIAAEWVATQSDWSEEKREDLLEQMAKRLGVDEPMDLPGATSRPSESAD